MPPTLKKRWPTDFAADTPSLDDLVFAHDTGGTNKKFVVEDIVDLFDTAYATQAELDALVISGGGMSVASEAEALAGTDNTKAMTPLRVRTVLPFVDVRRFGATGDGVTDDTAAVQAAIDAVGAAGGGTVYFPKGVYRITGGTLASGNAWQLVIRHDNITLAGDGHDSVIYGDWAGAATTVRLLSAFGPAKTEDIADWWGNDAFFQHRTVFTLDASVAKGATSITLDTPADAANFAADDFIYIRTGQTISGDDDQPDSEINRVVSADDTTGVIELLWPTVKPYAQEYFVSGTSGVSTTSVTANACLFGVTNVTDHIVSNISISNLRLSGMNVTQCLSIWQAFDVDVHRVWVGSESNAVNFRNLIGSQNARQVRIRRVSGRVPDTASSASWFVGPSTGCADWLIENCRMVGAGDAGYLHIHEGVGPIKVVASRFQLATISAGTNYVSIRGRAYDLEFDGSLFEAHGATSNNSLLLADSTVVGPGRIGGCTFRGSGAGIVNAIRVDSPDWKIEASNKIEVGSVSAYQTLSAFPVEYLQGWVTSASQQPTLGTIPAYARIVSVYIEVTQAFNSDAADGLTVGYAGANAAYATSVDVSTTGIKTWTAGSAIGFSATARAANSTYNNGGSEPTLGTALVVIGYQRCPRVT